MLTDPWKFREWKQLECYQKTDVPDQRNKTGHTVCHSGKQGQGWVEGGREVVRESSRMFQYQGRVSPGTGLGCEEALLGSESIQPNSAVWGSLPALALFSRRTKAPFKDWATGTIEKVLRTGAG